MASTGCADGGTIGQSDRFQFELEFGRCDLCFEDFEVTNGRIALNFTTGVGGSKLAFVSGLGLQYKGLAP